MKNFNFDVSSLMDISKCEVTEIGDGNLNFVFKLSDGTHTYALKHAKPYLKILGEDFALTPQRIIAEMNSMEYFYSLLPQYIPQIYLKNETEYFFVMQYLDGFTSLREDPQSGIYEKLGEVLYTLATNQPTKEAFYACDELKEITKNYVFEYAFIKDHPALSIADYALQKQFSKAFLTNKERLKEIFLHAKTSLIHGDFHTDSVMCKGDEVAIIDSEFSLFSEISFDIGNILAHTIFSSIARNDRLYREKFLLLFSKLEALENFSQILKNSIGFCAIEMARRLYVPAKSKDLESIKIMQDKKDAYALSFALADELGANDYTNVTSFIKRLDNYL
ncbi:MAG: phosphotransferase [Sulfurospirillum sp.]|nr:phosphotransferase [Sulfurospirillum sp.]